MFQLNFLIVVNASIETCANAILMVQSEYTVKVVANCKARLTPREIFQHLALQLTLLVQINVFSIINSLRPSDANMRR